MRITDLKKMMMNKQLKLFTKKKHLSGQYVLIGTSTEKRWYKYHYIKVIENKNRNVIKDTGNETMNNIIKNTQ